jgi:hypothetical protein
LAAHGVHSPPAGPEKPVEHRQAVAALLALGDCESGAHGEHSWSPTASLNVDGAHALHTPETRSAGASVLAAKSSKV